MKFILCAQRFASNAQTTYKFEKRVLHWNLHQEQIRRQEVNLRLALEQISTQEADFI